MVDSGKIKALMLERGYSQRTLSTKMGMSVNSLNSKINNKNTFSVDEASKLCDLLKIVDCESRCRIFFAQAVPVVER